MWILSFYDSLITRKDRLSDHFTVAVNIVNILYTTFYKARKDSVFSLRDLYALSFSVRKDILYESVKKFVKTRKEDLNAYFTACLRIRKFIISCCEWTTVRHDIRSPTERQRAVLKLQNILKKAADTGHDPHMSLLNFRSTPSAGMDTIPSQRLIHSEPALPCTYSWCEAQITTRTEELRSCHHTESEMWCRFDPYHVSQNGLKRKLVVR